MRCGIIAANSARNRHSSQPVRVMTMVTGIDAAPSVVTITGAMPVTRIVPARPITKAPSHPVSRFKLCSVCSILSPASGPPAGVVIVGVLIGLTDPPVSQRRTGTARR